MLAPESEPISAPVSLEQMLARREARVADQQNLLRRFKRPLVQLTLVTPGPIKDTTDARFVFEQGLAAMHQALAANGYAVLASEGACFMTGPEALLVVDADPLTIKRCLMALEEQHPLGRLWDLDVMGLEGASLSRRQFDVSPRRCLLCDQAAHACARGGIHALAQLQRAIQDKIDAYRDSPAN